MTLNDSEIVSKPGTGTCSIQCNPALPKEHITEIPFNLRIGMCGHNNKALGIMYMPKQIYSSGVFMVTFTQM